MPILIAVSQEVVGMVVLAFVVLGLILYKLQSRGGYEARIANYFRARGQEPLEILWRPFGTNGIGDYSYLVRYRDSRGDEYEASCRIDSWARVFVSESSTVQEPTPSSPRRESLEEENRRLRKELEALRNRNR